ncbi:MAG TPA: hypothetical protein VG711_04425 [Phycisphaerales bacterium]|nr:hypothetical protein [Phycisphaerales bacterium]
MKMEYALRVLIGRIFTTLVEIISLPVERIVHDGNQCAFSQFQNNMMIRSVNVLVVTCILASWACAHAQTIPASAPASPERFDPSTYRWRNQGRDIRDPSISLPIRQNELDYYVWILKLSDEQIADMDRRYEEYLTTNFHLRAETEAAIYESSGYNDVPGLSPQESAARAFEMLEKRNRFVARLNAVDANFFDGLAAILAEPQLARLDSVRMLRKRVVASLSPCRHTAGDFDLEIYALELFRQLPDPAVTYDKCESIFDQYASRATILWERQDHAVTEARMCYVQASPNFTSAGPLVPPDQMAVINSKLKAKRTANADLEVRRAELNAEFVSKIVDAMPSEIGPQLMAAFLQHAYPPVFPNPYDCSLVIRAINQSPTIAVDRKAALEPVTARYDSEMGILNKKMVQRYLEYVDNVLHNPGQDEARRETYKYDMDVLQTQRRDLSKRTMDTLNALLLPDELDDAVLTVISEFRQTSEHHMPNDAGMQYIP